MGLGGVANRIVSYLAEVDGLYAYMNNTNSWLNGVISTFIGIFITRYK